MRRPRADSTIHPWVRPRRIDQLELWPEGRDRVLAYAGVSIDEIERWRALGWISFDVREGYQLEDGQMAEILFIRNLAHSGLSEHQVGALLGELDPPYAYSPIRTAYSFAYGWVEMPNIPTEEEKDEFLERHAVSWIRKLVLLREYELLEQLSREILVGVAKAKVADRDRVEKGEG